MLAVLRVRKIPIPLAAAMRSRDGGVHAARRERIGAMRCQMHLVRAEHRSERIFRHENMLNADDNYGPSLNFRV